VFSNRFKKLFYFHRSEVEAVERVDRVEIDRNGNVLSIDVGEHAMLIRAPFGELGKIIKTRAELV